MFIKKMISGLMCVFIIYSIQADEYNEFRLLTPEQQVHKLIDEFKYEDTRAFGFNLKFAGYKKILMENHEAVRPVVFTYFEIINPPVRYDNSDKSFTIIMNIIMDFLDKKLLNKDAELQLANLFQKKLDYYLRIYKKIDRVAIMFEMIIINIKTGENIQDIPDYARNIWRKYRDLGYEDLEFNYYPYGKR